MSENNVIGFKINMQALSALVGSNGRFGASSILKGQETLAEEFDQINREWAQYAEHEHRSVEQLVTEILHGELDAEYATEYRRCLELFCRRIGVELSDRSKSQSLSRLQSFWRDDLNPVMKRLGLRSIADLWLKDNVAFPWGDAEAPFAEWPIATYLDSSDLADVMREFKAVNFTRLADFEKTLFTKKLEVTDPGAVMGIMLEMRDAIFELHRWAHLTTEDLGQSQQPDGLLIIVDGSQ